MKSDGALIDDAFDVAEQHMRQAKTAIDDMFTTGYARDNPELVATLVQVAAANFQTFMMVKESILDRGEE